MTKAAPGRGFFNDKAFFRTSGKTKPRPNGAGFYLKLGVKPKAVQGINPDVL
jgi:hypothetical protein